MKRLKKKVELTEKSNKRTLDQNKAIHLYCDMIAETFNEMGQQFSFTGVKGLEIKIKYSMILVKETMWKPIQIALFGFESTTELDTKQVGEIAEQIEIFFANIGIDLPFPNKENMI